MEVEQRVAGLKQNAGVAQTVLSAVSQVGNLRARARLPIASLRYDRKAMCHFISGIRLPNSEFFRRAEVD